MHVVRVYSIQSITLMTYKQDNIVHSEDFLCYNLTALKEIPQVQQGLVVNLSPLLGSVMHEVTSQKIPALYSLQNKTSFFSPHVVKTFDDVKKQRSLNPSSFTKILDKTYSTPWGRVLIQGFSCCVYTYADTFCKKTLGLIFGLSPNTPPE